jgi:methionyl aminopeptidase
MTREALECLREAGRIATSVRNEGARRIVPGATIREVCQFVDDEMARMGGAPAFPTQSSVNHVAAHYCPSPEDETEYREGDLAKLDLGVHVEGYVVDTALTVNVGDKPENRKYVEAAVEALDAAIGTAGPNVRVNNVAAAIELTIRAHGLTPVRNLCGHGVGRYTVHTSPSIPNVADGSTNRLVAGMVIAIEPFATDGKGLVNEEGKAEVFRYVGAPNRKGTAILSAVQAFRGLPFARRQLADFPRDDVDATLKTLERSGDLQVYPPLVERGRRPVAQAEKTIFISKDGVEVLTP